jgi:fructokinase
MSSVLAFGEVLFDCFPDKKIIGGAPFNVVAHLASFGLHPFMITRIGKDEDGATALQQAKTLKIDTDGFQEDKIHPTGYAQVVIENPGHRFELPFGQAWDYIDGQTAKNALQKKPSPQIVYFGTLVQRHEVSRHALQMVLEATLGLRFVDLNLRPPWWTKQVIETTLAATDWLKINDEELKILQNLFQLPNPLEDTLYQLKTRFALEGIILTCGDKGAFYFGGSGLLHQAAHLALDFKDAVGCGDAFASIILLGLLYNWPKETALFRASQFASAIAAIHGALPAASSFYEDFYKRWHLNG